MNMWKSEKDNRKFNQTGIYCPSLRNQKKMTRNKILACMVS